MRIRRKRNSHDSSFSPNPPQSSLKPSRGWGELQAKSDATGNSPLEFTPTQKPVQAQNYTLGEVGDVYEREADANAKQVVEHINSPETVQRNEEEGEDLQMKPQTLQRNEEEGEDLQMKPQTLQRNTAEEEDVQMKPQTLQRNEEEGEDLQMKPQTLQRNEEEGEDVQMKSLYPYIQRAILRDRPNTSEIQAKPLNPLLQRVVSRDLAEPRLGRDRNPPEMQAKPLNPLLQRVVSRDPEIQRNTTEEEDMQMKPLGRAIQRADGEENTLNREFGSTLDSAKRTGGQSLKPDLQAKMGEAMGADFSGVKVHTDATSDQLNQSIQAKAFTTGQDVFFKQGEYNPSSQGGQELIAHELTHVVQQNGNAVQRKKSDRATEPSETISSTQVTPSVQASWFGKGKKKKKSSSPKVPDFTGGEPEVDPIDLKPGDILLEQSKTLNIFGDHSDLAWIRIGQALLSRNLSGGKSTSVHAALAQGPSPTLMKLMEDGTAKKEDVSAASDRVYEAAGNDLANAVASKDLPHKVYRFDNSSLAQKARDLAKEDVDLSQKQKEKWRKNKPDPKKNKNKSFKNDPKVKGESEFKGHGAYTFSGAIGSLFHRSKRGKGAKAVEKGGFNENAFYCSNFAVRAYTKAHWAMEKKPEDTTPPINVDHRYVSPKKLEAVLLKSPKWSYKGVMLGYQLRKAKKNASNGSSQPKKKKKKNR